MLRLSKSAIEPVTWTLQPGVTITQKPLDSIGHEAAQARAQEQALMLREGAAILAEAGLDGGDFLRDGALRAGAAAYLLTVEYGVESITAWTGIGDADGAPIEPGRTAIAMLCRDPVIATEINRHALARIHAWHDEGNGSAVLPNGADRAADPIARAVDPKAPPAPGESA